MRFTKLVAVAFAVFAILVGCQKDPAPQGGNTVEQREILALLRQMKERGAVPTRNELREVFRPVATAIQALAVEQEGDRERVIRLSRELQDFSRIVEGSLERPAQDTMSKMRQRLDKLEQDVQAQQAKSKANREAILGTLNGAADRLDKLLNKMKEPAKSNATTSKPTTGKGASEGKGQAPPINAKGDTDQAGSDSSDSDSSDSAMWTYQVLVGFLGLSLVALVVLVVFFPNRLRAVPQTEFESQPEAPEQWLQLDPTVAAFLAQHEANGQQPAATTPAPTMQQAPPEPPRHHMVLDKGVVNGVQDQLADWLSQDPSVLTRPAPEVTAHDGVVEVSFSTRPDLTAGERVQIQDRLQRLLEPS